MTAQEADDRIMNSRRVLNGWEAMGVRKPEEALRMIHDEIPLLTRIAHEHPDKAAKIAALIGDWETFQAKVKGRAH